MMYILKICKTGIHPYYKVIFSYENGYIFNILFDEEFLY